MMEKAHYLSDLDEMIASLVARDQRNIEAVRELKRELTPVENARFEVGWGFIRDQLMDLRKMREWWAKDQPMYRKTEKMLKDAE
jgi:hypothetical protein